MPKQYPKKKAVRERFGLGKRSRAKQLAEARKKRRIHQDSQETVVSTRLGDDVVEPTPSTSRVKLDLMRTILPQHPDEASDENIEDYPNVAEDDGEEVGDYELNDESCLVIQVGALKRLFDNIPCPSCQRPKLSVETVNRKKGLVVGLRTVCDMCGHLPDFHDGYSSGRLGENTSRDPFLVTRKMVAATMDNGSGYAGLKKMCYWLDSPCIHQTTYVRHQTAVALSIDTTVNNVLDNAAVCVREAYAALDSDIDITRTIDIGVSFDGSWLTRGYKSLYGVATVIDLITNLVIDYKVLSLYCHGCATVGDLMEKDSEDYKAWYKDHICDQNYKGTSGGMESAIAEVLWKRSIDRHNFRYMNLLSDGDAKTFKHLTELCVYGEDHAVTKEECVNHVSKRMGTALRKLPAQGRAGGVTIGGKGHGKLTKHTIDKLTGYYQKAIKSNPNNLGAMRDAVFASFYHAVSTDEDPQHNKCPAGEESWCFFRRAEARGEIPGPHKQHVGTPLSQEVATLVKPVYDRLGSDELLSRCLRGKTQNSNESLHSLIYRKIHKEEFFGRIRVEAAVAAAISEFNQGVSRTVAETVSNMGMEVGSSTAKLTKAKDELRVRAMDKKSMEKEKRKRESRRLARQRVTEGEGEYQAGGF